MCMCVHPHTDTCACTQKYVIFMAFLQQQWFCECTLLLCCTFITSHFLCHTHTLDFVNIILFSFYFLRKVCTVARIYIYIQHLNVQALFCSMLQKFASCAVGRVGCCCHHMWPHTHCITQFAATCRSNNCLLQVN
jgi:hypothetical protein